MSNFLKLLTASCLGTLLALGVLVFVGVVSVSSIAARFERAAVDVEANSVLVIAPRVLPELRDNTQDAPLSLDDDHVYGLRDLTRALALAAEDDDIKGAYLDVDAAVLGPASAATLREAVVRFRESGKFVVAHALNYGQGGYFLASAADAVYLNPTGGVDLRGYGVTAPFFTGALEKLGVEMNVFYAGDFKSAGEPFFRESLSDSNRLQTRIYLEDLWRLYTEAVAPDRGMSPERLRGLAYGFEVRTDSAALAAGLVDGLYYEDEVLDDLRARIGLDADEPVRTVKLDEYAARLKPVNLRSDDRIAVVFAEGNITDGAEAPGLISGEAYADLLREIRRDDEVRAIVLRINSGGGSAMASENIWREVRLAREAGIPVVASMGDVAASGGYYIAVATDSIFARANTITGSIGVIGLLPNVSTLMEDRLGITFDTVNTGRYSNAFSPVIPLESDEEAIIQESIDRIYRHFVSRVAEGRDMSVGEVRRLAKGRVYTGEDALALGLVDRLGGLDDAIAAAARMADLDLDGARISEYPKVATPLEEIVARLSGQDDDEDDIRVLTRALRHGGYPELGVLGESYQLIRVKGPQMIWTDQVIPR